MLQRVLLPLDGSRTAEAILPQVRRILRSSVSEVLLVHAWSFPAPTDGFEASIVPRMQEDAERYVEGVKDRLQSEGFQVRCVVRDGPAADVILGVAASEKVSLIAMSTHGRTGLPRWVFGSVCEKVLRASPVPVLVLRSFVPSESGDMAEAPAEELPVRCILLPLDGSRTATGVLPQVISLARTLGSRVALLHVLEPHEDSDAAEVADETFQGPRQKLAEAGIEVLTCSARGEPAEEIVKSAESEGADLIAMTTHGRSGVTRWVFGSVTEKVLREARVPVLVARSGTAKP